MMGLLQFPRPQQLRESMLPVVAEALAEGKKGRAERRALSGIGAIEQYCLDRHWKTAWKPMDLDRPLFESWERMNAELLRSENANTRLASRRWIAALICEMKDEDLLHK